MSFSSNAKNEMIHNELNKPCCKKAFLASVIKSIGTVSIRSRHKLTLRIVTENGAIARKIYGLFKELFSFTPQIIVQQKQSLKKNNLYILNLTGEQNIRDILTKLGIFHDNMLLSLTQGVEPDNIQSDCCKRAYLRGTFVSSGSVSNPHRAYHLEMVFSSQAYAEDIKDLLHHFGLNAKVILRKNQYVVYMKEADHISDFLTLCGAYVTVLELENLRAFKQVKNDVQRLVNCETANLTKTVDAASRQIQNIRYIENTIGLHSLEPKLEEIARLRLAYPEESLKEIGTLLSPPIGKSGVNHRLRRIDDIAERLRERAGN